MSPQVVEGLGERKAKSEPGNPGVLQGAAQPVGQFYRLLPYMLVAAALIAYVAPFLRVFSHGVDEGGFFNFAERINRGQLPFRDFFTSLAPGTYYLLAAYFKLLGTSWLTTRIYVLVTTLTTVVALFHLARRFGCGSGAGPVVFFMAVSYSTWDNVSHHGDSVALALVSFIALLEWIDRRRGITLVLAGAGAGITTFFMQPKGVLLYLSFVFITGIYFRSKRAVIQVTAGYAVVGLIATAWLASMGLLGTAFRDTVIWPYQNYSQINRVYYGMWLKEYYWHAWTSSFVPALSAVPGYLLSAMLSTPFVVVLMLPVLVAGLIVRFRRSAFDPCSVACLCAGAAMLVSEMHRKDLFHLVYGCPLLLLFAYRFWLRLQGRSAKTGMRAVMICAGLLLALNPAIALLSNHRVVTRRGTMYDADATDEILGYLMEHTMPGDSIWVYPYSSNYYFLTATENATPFDTLLYGYSTPEQLHEATRAVETKKVRYVVRDTRFAEREKVSLPGYRQPALNQEIVEPYLEMHYTPIMKSESGYELLERRDLQR